MVTHLSISLGLIAKLYLSDHSLSLPLLLGHACIVQVLTIWVFTKFKLSCQIWQNCLILLPNLANLPHYVKIKNPLNMRNGLFFQKGKDRPVKCLYDSQYKHEPTIRAVKVNGQIRQFGQLNLNFKKTQMGTIRAAQYMTPIVSQKTNRNLPADVCLGIYLIKVNKYFN